MLPLNMQTTLLNLQPQLITSMPKIHHCLMFPAPLTKIKIPPAPANPPLPALNQPTLHHPLLHFLSFFAVVGPEGIFVG